MPSPVSPFLRYSDPAEAISWLAEVFGFRPGLVVPGPDGSIVHAELHLGGTVVMLGPDRDDLLGVRAPSGDTPRTGGIYIAVDDPDAAFARARDAGATVLRPPHDTEYDSREWHVLDPGGHVWSVGSYRPSDEIVTA
jgi:uncharacterized glyoxalase superfamily protein PhnB